MERSQKIKDSLQNQTIKLSVHKTLFNTILNSIFTITVDTIVSLGFSNVCPNGSIKGQKYVAW